MRRIAAFLLACSLVGPVTPQEAGGKPAIDRAFLERCLGQVEEIPAWDAGTGLEAGILIFSTVLAGAELLKICRREYDVYPFLAGGGVFLFNEFRYMGEYRSRSESICREVAATGGRDAQIRALEKAARNSDNAADALMDRGQNYERTAVVYSAAAATALFFALASTPGTGPNGPQKKVTIGRGCWIPDSKSCECDQGECSEEDVQRVQTCINVKAGGSFGGGGDGQPPEAVQGGVGAGEDARYKRTRSARPAGALPRSLRLAPGLFDVLFPPAEAGKILKNNFFWGLSAAAMSALLIGTKYFSWAQTMIRKWARNGYVRAAGYSALAGIALLAGKRAKGDSRKARKESAAYRATAAEMRRKWAKWKEDLRGQVEILPPARRGEAAGKGETSAVGFPCAAGTAGGFPALDADCRCRANNSCHKAKVPKVHFPRFDQKGVLGEVAANLKGMADNTYRGNFKRADLYSARLAKQAGGVRRLREKARRMHDKFFARRGGAKFANMEKKMGDDLARAIRADFKNLPLGPKGKLASLGFGGKSLGIGGVAKKAASAPLPLPKMPIIEPAKKEVKREKLVGLSHIPAPEGFNPTPEQMEMAKKRAAEYMLKATIHPATGRSLWERKSRRYSIVV